MELLSFMDLEEAKEYYKLIKKEFPPTDENINNFYKYFEDTWLSLDDNDIPRYPFDIWTYNKKFNFKGTKKVLINEDKLNEYVCFTNKACESFNHLMNSCLSNNTSVSFNKFTEILKFIFLRLESSVDSNNEKIENKTFVSDILRELINFGYGKNKKIIRIPELKKKFQMNMNILQNLIQLIMKEDNHLHIIFLVNLLLIILI